MAKTLGPKSRLIRQAISDNPETGNTELARMLSAAKERKDDKIKLTPQDVAQQRQVMKKAGQLTATGKKRGRPRGATQAAKQPGASAAAAASPVDLIDKTIDLAQQCGGVAALKKLVDRLADMRNG
jgi:hypothetical protein